MSPRVRVTEEQLLQALQKIAAADAGTGIVQPHPNVRARWEQLAAAHPEEVTA